MAKDNKKNEVPKNPRVDLYPIAVYYIFQACFIKAQIIADDEFEERRWAGRLIKEIKASPDNIEISDSESYKQYLNDRFRQACDDINENKPYEIKGYSRANLKPLMEYGGISDYEALNSAFRSPQSSYIIRDVKKSKLKTDAITRFLTGAAAVEVTADLQIPNENISETEKEPVKIPAVYVSKPYGRLDILGRIVDDEGELWFYNNGDCQWRGDQIFMIEQPYLNRPEAFRMPGDTERLWVKVCFSDKRQACCLYFAEQAGPETPLRLLPSKKIADCFLAGHLKNNLPV